MRNEYDYRDGEFATAVAASAFAIHSREEYQGDVRVESEIPLSRVETRRDEHSRQAETPSTRRPYGQDNKASSSLRSVPSTTKDQKQQRSLMRQRNAESKIDAWEKAELEKIKKRYEKMHSDILAWENEKKAKAKLQLEKKKNELAHRRDRNLQHYRIKIAKIDHIAQGAKEQVEEKRKYKTSALKERAKKNRSAGKAQVCCYCF